MYRLTDYAVHAKKNSYKLPTVVLQSLHALCVAIHTEPVFEFNQDIRQTKQDVIRELNKITETSSFDTFLSILTQENIQDFADDIFTILTSNSYLMKTYCTLFLLLMKEYTIFEDIFTRKLTTHQASFSTIRFGDPSEYTLFCDINKENHSRKLFTQFITELDHLNSSTHGQVLCKYIMDYIDSLLSTPSKDVVYECIEHVSILSKYTIYDKPKIEAYCELESSTPGVHTKFIFTCMDILKV
jgi:hypothetical protein